MTGIQHRWDCPAKIRGIATEMAETRLVIGHVEFRRCLYCHRSATIDLPEEQEQ